ncbi:MAG: 30S ribosome-binding factor RbfA [Clostridia bacterium]|jgi:ribosome-binding factor A|nr:30S ribosome-binding factor RbfA [Clostridia bacterium]MDH7572379.1 30S ribosome-binding factor RbfA [Clostridia bacterium]
MARQRVQRVAEQIKKEIASILKHEMKDPRLGFVSVTDVELSPDLHYAKVYVSVLGDDQAQRESLEVLNKATGFVRREIGERLSLRFVPELAFRFDPSIQRGARIAELLHQLRREQGETSGTDNGESKHEPADE